MARRKRSANLSSVVEPKFITLTKAPSNRTGFKVVRSADGETTEVKEPLSTVEEAARKESSSLEYIRLPDGATQEDALVIREEYGLEDYVIRAVDSVIYLIRNDESMDADVTPIGISNDMVAYVRSEAFSRSEEKVALDCKKQGKVGVVAVRFDKSNYETTDKVESWLADNGIDYPKGAITQTGEVYTVVRDEDQGATIEVSMGDGVTGVVSNNSEIGVPTKVYRYVMEEAYGLGGYGHLDFNAAMAGSIFEQGSWEALYFLRDVLENIVFYSHLDLDTRQKLIYNALNGYGDYMASLIDALPKGVLEQTRSDKLTGREITMSNKERSAAKSDNTTTQEGVERSELEAVAATEAPVVEAADAVEATDSETKSEGFVTRAEMTEIVSSAVAAALEEAKRASSEVNDAVEGASEEATDESTAKRSEAESSDMANLLKAIGSMVEKVDSLSTEVQQVRSEVEDTKSGVTVARSSDSSGEQEATPKEAPSVFSGVFGSLTR